MAKKFKTLVAKTLPKEARDRAKRKAKLLLAELPLHELRRAREITQQQIAEVLEIEQPSVSKIENRTDMYISTLRSYIEAMGGNLRIVAKFPEGEVQISQFKDLDEKHPDTD